MLEMSTTELPVFRTLAVRRRLPLRLQLGLACAASAVLAVVTFAPAVRHGFVWDDHVFIEHHPVVTQGPWYRAWREPFWPRGTSSDTLFRPFTTFTYRMETVLGGTGKPEPALVHVTNLTLHSLTGVAVVLLAFGLSRRVTAGLVAGVLFAVHPLHAEAVVPGYGRSELLAGCLGAWLLALQVTVRRPRTRWFYPLCSLLYLLALMSKEHALFLWPAFVAIEYWPGADGARAPRPEADKMPSLREPMARREWVNRCLIPSQIGLILATSCYFTLRAGVFKDTFFLDTTRTRVWECPFPHSGVVEQVLTPFRLLWISFELCVWPGRLCPIWSIPATPMASRPAADVLGGIMLLAALLAAAFLCWRKRHVAGAMVTGLIFTLLIPVQAFGVAHWLFAERWLYMPTVFAAALLGIAVAGLRWPGVAAALAVGGLLLPASWSYSRAFESELAMNREVVARQPNNYQGHRNLGWIHLVIEKDYVAAIQESREMIRLFGPFGRMDDAYRYMALAYLELGDGEEALRAIREVLRIQADIPDPAWTSRQFQAEALIARKRARQAAASQPESAPAPGR